MQNDKARRKEQPGYGVAETVSVRVVVLPVALVALRVTVAGNAAN